MTRLKVSWRRAQPIDGPPDGCLHLLDEFDALGAYIIQVVQHDAGWRVGCDRRTNDSGVEVCDSSDAAGDSGAFDKALLASLATDIRPRGFRWERPRVSRNSNWVRTYDKHNFGYIQRT